MKSPPISRRVHISFFILFFLLLMGGCTGEGARELYETAQFEERQHNQTHARELYQQIIAKFPKSEFANKAQTRLKELQHTP